MYRFKILWSVEVVFAGLTEVMQGYIVTDQPCGIAKIFITGAVVMVNTGHVLIQIVFRREVWPIRTGRADVMAWRAGKMLLLGWGGVEWLLTSIASCVLRGCAEMLHKGILVWKWTIAGVTVAHFDGVLVETGDIWRGEAFRWYWMFLKPRTLGRW